MEDPNRSSSPIILEPNTRMNPAEPSRYDALPTRSSFRLLSLHGASEGDSNPSLTSTHSPIAAALRTYELLEAPPFKALSYTWGPPYRDIFQEDTESPPEFTKQIVCNGTSMPVTQNLYDALWNLRKRGMSGEWWIDAICINQESITERSAQVLLMGDVYASAELVVVWLGPHREGIDDLAWAISEFVLVVQEFKYDSYGIPEHGYPAQQDEAFWACYGLEPPLARLVNAAYFYTACRWFKRAWIIQEVLLARAVIILCGETELNIADMVATANHLSKLGWREAIATAINATKLGIDYVLLEDLGLWNMISSAEVRRDGFELHRKQWKNNSEVFWWLSIILWMCRSAACQDPRDKLYSILGILSRLFPETPIGNFITPDYNISTCELFTRVTMLILDHSTSLDYISDVRRRSPGLALQKLPSWAVNYSSTLETDGLVKLNPNFNAARGVEGIYPPFVVTLTTIFCHGARFDKIHEISRFTLQEMLDSHFLDLVQVLLSLPLQIQGLRRVEVFWRTLITNYSTFNDNVAASSAEEDFIAWFTSNYCACLQTSKSQEDLNNYKSFLSLFDTADSAEKSIQKDIILFQKLEENKWSEGVDEEGRISFLTRVTAMDARQFNWVQQFASVVPGKRLFVTESGFLGLGLDIVQAGDQVWLLCDASKPFVLRGTEEPSTFTNGGACYIHNFMNGEMLDEFWDVKKRIGQINII